MSATVFFQEQKICFSSKRDFLQDSLEKGTIQNVPETQEMAFIGKTRLLPHIRKCEDTWQLQPGTCTILHPSTPPTSTGPFNRHEFALVLVAAAPQMTLGVDMQPPLETCRGYTFFKEKSHVQRRVQEGENM